MISDTIAWFVDPANWAGADGVPNRLLQHVGYVLSALALAAVIAVPAGLYIGHTGRGGVTLVGAANAIRALPTLGLVTFLFLLFYDSETASMIGLVVLGVPSILAGTYAGLQSTDRDVIDAAEGMGMTGWQRMWKVELPIAVPLVLGGVRNSALQLVATAAVAAYVGLGGLGRYVFDGLAVFDYGEVVAGAVFTALLAVVLDLVFGGLQRTVVPRGVRLAADASKGRQVVTRGGEAG